jgi:hypothetical protein
MLTMAAQTAAFDAVFAPRRARDRVPSILALGLFSFGRLPNHASYSPPLHFFTPGSEMPLTEEPSLCKVSYFFNRDLSPLILSLVEGA